MMITKKEFSNYCGSPDYHADMHLSGYKSRSPKLEIYREIKASLGGEHSSKHSGNEVVIHSNCNNKLDDPINALLNELHQLELWGANFGMTVTKEGYYLIDPAFGTHNALSYHFVSTHWKHHQVWHPGDPGCIRRQYDKGISQYFYVKEEYNIREWGAMDKHISDQDDGEDQK